MSAPTPPTDTSKECECGWYRGPLYRKGLGNFPVLYVHNLLIDHIHTTVYSQVQLSSSFRLPFVASVCVRVCKLCS